MLKKIRLAVHSNIENLDDFGLCDTDAEVTDISAEGIMKCFDGEIKLSYKEQTEGGAVFCDIMQREGYTVVSRKGAINSFMRFAEGEEYETVYELTPYKFDMKIKTLRLKSTLAEGGGELSILYTMTVGGAAKKVRMRISVSEVNAL